MEKNPIEKKTTQPNQKTKGKGEKEENQTHDPKKAFQVKDAKTEAQKGKGGLTEVPELIEFPDGAITLKMPKRMKWYLWIRFPILHPYITATVILSLTIISTFTWLILDTPESVKEFFANLNKKPPMATIVPQVPYNIRKQVDKQGPQKEQRIPYKKYMAIAKRQHAAGDHEAALKTYIQAMLQNPSSAEAYNAAASEAIEMGTYYQAEQYLKRAIELDQAYAMAHYNLGRLYLITGDTAQAHQQQQILQQVDNTLAKILKNQINNEQEDPGQE